MYIKDIRVTEKEKELISIITKVGHYSKLYNKDLYISRYVIDNTIKKGFVKKNNPALIFSEMTPYYTLTDKGIEYARNVLLINPYRGREKQIAHDYVLGKVYLNLSDEEKKTWITETQLENKYKDITVIDGIYENKNKERVGVEIITATYTEKIIEEKKEFIKRFCDKEIFIDITKL